MPHRCDIRWGMCLFWAWALWCSGCWWPRRCWHGLSLWRRGRRSPCPSRCVERPGCCGRGRRVAAGMAGGVSLPAVRCSGTGRRGRCARRRRRRQTARSPCTTCRCGSMASIGSCSQQAARLGEPSMLGKAPTACGRARGCGCGLGARRIRRRGQCFDRPCMPQRSQPKAHPIEIFDGGALLADVRPNPDLSDPIVQFP